MEDIKEYFAVITTAFIILLDNVGSQGVPSYNNTSVYSQEGTYMSIQATCTFNAPCYYN